MSARRTGRGARILITGGAGFVGSTIADQALEAGVDSIVLIDNLVRGRHENLETAMSARRGRPRHR